MARLIETVPVEPLATPRRSDPFSTLARAIVGQQLSNRAASTIWDRVVRSVGGVVTPTALLSLEHDVLRACGLSRAKVDYTRDLASRILAGDLVPSCWPSMEDDHVLRELTAVRGIGRWTAHMYLIFHEARLDVLAVDDAALLRAASHLYGRGHPLTPQELVDVSKPWQPWRSVASVYLWGFIDQVPAEPPR